MIVPAVVEANAQEYELILLNRYWLMCGCTDLSYADETVLVNVVRTTI